MPRTAMHAVGPAGLCLLLGLWGIRREGSMWGDEAATWQAAHRSVPDLCRLLDHVDVVHGLYYLFMHGVFAVLGDSLIALRLPSVLAMTGATLLIALLGARLADRCTGAAAGLAFALLPAVQRYAQEGRPYAMVAACVVLACLLLVRAVDRPRAGAWAAYGTVVLVGALLNWFSLLVLCAHAVTLALVRPSRAVLVGWALASSAAVLGVLPLAVASAAQSGQVDWIPPTRPGTLRGVLLTLVAGALLARCARPSGDDRGPSGARLPLGTVALPLLAVPPLALLGVSLVHPLYVDRYVLFGQLGLALLVGAACHAQARRLRMPPRRLVAAASVVALLALLPLQCSLRHASGRSDDVLSAAANAAAVLQAGDGVLYIPAARRDTALVSPADFTGTRDLALAQSPLESGTLSGVEGSPRAIAAAMLTARRIVVVSGPRMPSAPTARDRAKLRVLGDRFRRVSTTVERGRRISVYQRRATGHEHVVPRAGTVPSRR
ncbi:glycosyltransferase family 39 protein [Streptomyces sp. NPDC050095]|uniref:glycosyltransferase family 39 protein n=1 Tax=unclassified Streptomyces TaxID=2593676 RepID=UPI0034321104